MPPVPPTPDPIPKGLAMLVWTYGKNEHTPGPGFGLDAWQHAGPKYIWVRDIRPLVDGEALTPFTRAAMAGDMVSSLTHYGTEGLQFINADYTLTLSRLPEGPYLGLAALTHYSHDGVATGAATIVDQHGPIGSGVATALVEPRLQPAAPLTRLEDHHRDLAVGPALVVVEVRVRPRPASATAAPARPGRRVTACTARRSDRSRCTRRGWPPDCGTTAGSRRDRPSTRRRSRRRRRSCTPAA